MDKGKFCECVSKYRNHLYLTAWAILENEAEAEDAVGNAILKAYEHLGQLRNAHKFKSWMITITKNEALKIKKKRLELPGDEVVQAILNPVQEHYDELSDVLREIKEEYRLVIVLYYYDGLSIRDIAKVLDIPTGTVKSRLSRGKQMLKAILGRGDEHGGD